LRYGAGIRNLGSVLFIVGTVSGKAFSLSIFTFIWYIPQMLWLPVALYVPAITYNQGEFDFRLSIIIFINWLLIHALRKMGVY